MSPSLQHNKRLHLAARLATAGTASSRRAPRLREGVGLAAEHERPRLAAAARALRRRRLPHRPDRVAVHLALAQRAAAGARGLPQLAQRRDEVRRADHAHDGLLAGVPEGRARDRLRVQRVEGAADGVVDVQEDDLAGFGDELVGGVRVQELDDLVSRRRLRDQPRRLAQGAGQEVARAVDSSFSSRRARACWVQC